METTIIFWGHIGIMENRMESLILGNPHVQLGTSGALTPRSYFPSLKGGLG